jgi:Carboxypeptidase regulatory-like domain/TonB dependent receptor-like, beta-barrel/TonB-dependent Receptor Plug Domain
MRTGTSFVLALAFSCTMHAHELAAQSISGALIGTLTDTQGGVLAGAIVRVSSPSLIGGSQMVTTDARGQLRFPALPPGEYSLDIEVHGFKAYHEQSIRIATGATIERAIALDLNGVAESVVVDGTGSRLEARGSGFETRFGPEDLRAIPTRRFSMFDFVRAAPGVSATSPGSGSTNSISAFGSGTNENAYLIDGTNFTCPCSGEARSEPGVDFIQEVRVQSAGASAEFGNMQGAVINVITRQGSNRFLNDTSYYGQTAGLTSQPVQLVYPGPARAKSGYERAKYHDLTTNLGGPVARDHVWFFTGYQHLRDYDSQPGTDPSLPRTYEQDKVFAKLTWRIAPKLQLVQSYHQEFWVNPELPTFAKPFEATQRRHASVPAVTFGDLTHTWSPNTVWEVRVGRFVYTRDDDPSTGDVTIPGRFDSVTGLSSGAPQSFGRLELARTTVKGTVDHYQSDLLGADHQWRIGSQFEEGDHQLSSIIPTGVRYVDKNGVPSEAVSSDPSIAGGKSITASAFVSDAITVGRSLTINAGVRFDHSQAISQDLPVLDADGQKTSEMVQGLGTLYTWNVWSPRLGVTMKLAGDGRTILRGTYGRFNQGVLTGELAPFHPAATPTTRAAFDPATGGYPTVISVVDPNINLQLDPATRTPHTDEYSIGVDRELRGGFSVATAYIGKRGGDFVGWTDVGGRYHEELRHVANGTNVPVFVLDNSPADRRFSLTNPAGYSLAYDGVVMAVDKRRSNGWQAFGSYTFSRASGLQVASNGLASDPQVSTIAGSPYLTFGQDPNTLTNARGRLPNDRPHMLRVMGSADVPRIRVTIAGNVQYLSGKPWAATALISQLPQGDQRVLIEPRGSRRLSSQTLLDLRLSKAFSIHATTRVELFADLLNALNDTAEERLASDNIASATFGQPTAFVDPRRAMLGVKLNLGR